MQSIHSLIKTSIIKKGRGKIFFGNDFRCYGSGEAVRLTLFRLCKENLIERLSAGIYLYPKQSEHFGTIYPSVETIAKSIARKEKSRLIPTGSYALNALGLSTQVPMRIVFLTDGAARMIKVGKKASIKFKKTVAKNLAFKGEISLLVVSALKEIGKDRVTEEQLQKIKEALQHETTENVIHDAKLAPEWISKILLKLIYNE